MANQTMNFTTVKPTEANPFGGVPGQEGTDAAFVIISSFIIFTMQSGFGLLESGIVSTKSEANVIVKNMVDVILGGIAYWFVGYGFSFGPNTKGSKVFSGEGRFITDVEIGTNDEALVYTQFIFQLSFATTACTIVSGAVAERIKLSSYMIFILIKCSIIYTIPVHWVWDGNGWLNNGGNGAADFAGSAVVHMCGGAAAFAGAWILGPRNYRFTTKDEDRFRMASPTNVVLGTFFLWWGWIGFNCGSAFAITGDNWRVVGRIGVVTMNGAMAGGAAIIVLNTIQFLTKKRKYFLDIGEFTAGVLGGLVAITGGCNQFRPWEGLVIGFIGGLVAVGIIQALIKMKIDDPVGCVGVHWGAGFWGMIATGLFGMDGGVFRKGDGTMLGYNIAACVAITAWSFGLSAIVFGLLAASECCGLGLRMSEEEEDIGSDRIEHDVRDVVYVEDNKDVRRRRSSVFGSKRLQVRKKEKQEDDVELNGVDNNAVVPL